MGRVSVIVLNWNGKTFLGDCLASLRAQTHPCEVVVVDNGSREGSVEFVKTNFPGVEVVALPENRGFTGGNREGLHVTNGEFLALLNNDARAEPQWLERLVQPMVEDPRVGICASKLLLESGGRINGAGIGITTAGVGFDRGFGESPDSYGVREPVFGACAAAALYRRSMLEEIGFFDDDFFLYNEDVDLSFRAQLAGWKCVYVPEAIVHHRMNATAGRLSDLHVYYHTRNLEFVWLKNMPLALMLRYFHHKLLQEIGSFFYLCLRHGKWGPYFRAKRDALKMLPRMLQKRREVQRRRKASNRYIRSLMTPVFDPRYLRHKARQLVQG
jgi:GT2 family glycosyltransferase